MLVLIMTCGSTFRDGAARTPTDQAENEVNGEISASSQSGCGGSLTFPECKLRRKWQTSSGGFIGFQYSK